MKQTTLQTTSSEKVELIADLCSFPSNRTKFDAYSTAFAMSRKYKACTVSGIKNWNLFLQQRMFRITSILHELVAFMY